MGKKSMNIRFNKQTSNRKAYRAQISGLHVKVVGRPAVYAAKDLSPTGVGLAGGIGLREGKVLAVNLFYKGALVASEIKAHVVRAAATFTGLSFIDMSRRQADAVHALVLEEQKVQAELRKKEKLKKY